MPIYQIDIEKSFSPTTGNTVYWTNVYHVNTADLASAITAGNSIVTLEKTIHANATTFTKMRTRNTSDLAQAGTITPLTGTGGRAATNPLPLFNVFRIDFGVSSGRPSRKYIRGPLGSGDSTNGAVTSTTVTTIQNSFIAPMLNLNVVTDPQGQPWLNGTVWPYVGMRQLRRGSKRKTTPVI
jgi:hypothetical protein